MAHLGTGSLGQSEASIAYEAKGDSGFSVLTGIRCFWLLSPPWAKP